MMDQLASVGVEFDEKSLHKIFHHQCTHYDSLPSPATGASKSKPPRPWAVDAIRVPNTPRRPWSLGEIKRASNPLYALAGKKPRTPGLYTRVAAKARAARSEFLTDT